MNDETLRSLGKLVADESQQRDAVHIAVVPVVAGEELAPGDHAKLIDGRAFGSKLKKETIGAIDPFLSRNVKVGERCWLFLNPGSITGLRHHWSHPAFPIENPTEADRKREAEAWIRQYLADNGKAVSYETFIEVCSSGSQYVAHGYDLHLGITEEAWEQVEIVTGRKYDDAHRSDTWFSCSC